MKRISKYITQFRVGISNCYLIEGNDGLSLVDTGDANSSESIIKAINKAGYDLHDLKRILITHAHGDHIGSLCDMQQRTGAEVWAHDLDAAIIEAKQVQETAPQDGFNIIDRLMFRLGSSAELPTCEVHRTLKASEAISEVLEGLEVIHLPGHSAGQIGFWLPKESILIGGDVMMNIMGRLTQPFKAFTPDLPESRKSIQKVANLGLKTLALGHGPVIMKNAQVRVRKLVDKLDL